MQRPNLQAHLPACIQKDSELKIKDKSMEKGNRDDE